MAIGIKEGTRYLRKYDKCCTASVRLVEKESKNGKTFYEGGFQLANGQWVYISTGGSLKVNSTNNGREYVTVNVKVTGLKSGNASRRWYYGA